MTFLAEIKAIEGRLKTAWTTTTPIRYENMEYTPTPGTAWIEITVSNGESFQPDINNDAPKYRNLGIIGINIYVPKGTASHIARGYCDTLAAIYRSKQFDGIVCRTPEIQYIGTEEQWAVYNVSTPFYRDELL